jgi:serine protease Do
MSENDNENSKMNNFDPITGEQINPDYKGWDSVAAESNENKTYESYDTSGEPEFAEQGNNNAPTKKKRWGIGKKLGFAAAIAAVCGLVGGSVFYGVNFLGNTVFYNTKAAVESEASAEASSDALAVIEADDLESVAGNVELSRADYTSSTTAIEATGSVAEVAANCMPSLVTIACVTTVEMQNMFGQTQSYEAQGAGSGVIVGVNDTELLIATNNHVVSGATSLSVGFIDETTVEALVKGTDSNNDLAIVAVKLEDIPQETYDQIKIATIGNSDELVLGEGAVAIGNALGYGQSVTSGVISALHRQMQFSDGKYTITQDDLIQTDAPINSGNSGGGLFNMRGELIGINEAKESVSSSGAVVDGIGYAIAIDKAEPILEELMNRETRELVEEDEAGYLGVTCVSVTSDISKAYSIPVGVCFESVLEGSPAEEAGVKVGDVLVKFDGQSVQSYDDLQNVLKYYAAGETVEMTVMRASEGEYKEIDLTITLGTYDVISQLSQRG